MESVPLQTEGIVVEAANQGFRLMPIVLDDVRPDDVLVEIKYTGICHTEIFSETGGYPTLQFPAALGHEGAGLIRAVGSEVQNPALKVGTAVILSFNHCGSCRNCASGHPACCSNFEALNITGKRLSDQSTPARLADGRRLESRFFGQSSFIRLTAVSQHSVIPCPYPEDLAVYAALGCGFQTGAGTVLNALKPEVDDSLVIFGVGTVGLAAIMGAKYKGLKQIIAVDIVDEKLALAKELGATHTLNSKRFSDVTAQIRDVTGGGAQFAVDCTGASIIIQMLLDCVCSAGTAVIVGAPKPDLVLKVDPVDMLHSNKTLRGICQGDSVPSKFIPEMMEMHKAGRFPLEKMCTYYDVRDFQKAIADVKAGKIIKPILQWSRDVRL